MDIKDAICYTSFVPVNAGLSALFDGFVFMTKYFRGSRMLRADRAETSGFTGTFNLVFTGEGGGSWHCLLKDDSLQFMKGAHENPRGTVSVSVQDFFRMLSGELSYVTAEMTGRIKITGEGHTSMLLGAIITQLHAMEKRKDLRGKITRWLVQRAINKSGFQLQRK